MKRRKQHCPEAAVHLMGPPHSVRDMTVIPAAPATPTSPSPARTGARPAAAAPGRTAVPATPTVARRAKPPDQIVTIMQELPS